MLDIKPAKAMHYLLQIITDWKHDYHTNKQGEIVFQNKRLISNIRFDDKSFQTIAKHSTGFENIPQVVTDPDEVWSSWENTKLQRAVLRNYIKFGKISYVVQTRDGIITDAFVVTNSACDKFRKGVPL